MSVLLIAGDLRDANYARVAVRKHGATVSSFRCNIRRTMPIVCRFENRKSFPVSVVILGQEQQQIWEQSTRVPAAQSVALECPAGDVVISVFNLTNDDLYMCQVLRIADSVELPIT